ncbi:jg1493, partial [Pararge aegeria aegeria]
MHLDPAPAEVKEAKEQEVDWFAEHGKPTNTNETAEQVPAGGQSLSS